jgi:hypothetical protein
MTPRTFEPPTKHSPSVEGDVPNLSLERLVTGLRTVPFRLCAPMNLYADKSAATHAIKAQSFLKKIGLVDCNHAI